MSDSSARSLVAEGLVIVLSILAAFALDTWWDGRGERVEELETLEALHAEFSSARGTVVYVRGLQERILHSVGSVTDSLDAAVRRGDRSIVLPDTALGLAYIPPTTSLSLGTLTGLLASGRLGIVQSRELRTALASWGEDVEELAEEEEDLRDLAYGDMDRALRAVMNTNGLWRSGNDVIGGSMSAEAMRASRLVPATTEVLGVLHLRRSILTHAIREFEGLLGAIDEILALIEESP